jgi:alkylhydroperoxidase/carboxymuconolactone decarboxylase family protein YurZ
MKKLTLLFLCSLLNFTHMNAQTTYINQALDAKQRSIINISAFTAKGDIPALKTELSAGLDAGLTINEIKEELVQLYAYCGFPRSLNGINAFMAVIEERKAHGKNDPVGKDASPIDKAADKYQTGKANLQKLTNREEKELAGANAFAPAIDTFLKEHLFADIFGRDILTYQQRELITITALATIPGVEPQLQAHINMGMNIGITEAQLSETFSTIGKSVGKAEEDSATEVLKKVIALRKQ